MDTFPVDRPDMHEDSPVIRVPSSLSHEAADTLKRTAERCFASYEVRRLVLDLTLVEVVTSIGVTSLLEVRQLANDHGAELVLAGLPERHRSFFTLLRVEPLFRFVQSVESALSGGA